MHTLKSLNEGETQPSKMTQKEVHAVEVMNQAETVS